MNRRQSHWLIKVTWPDKNSRSGKSAGEPVSADRFDTLPEALASRQSYEDGELPYIQAGSKEGFRFVACLVSLDEDGYDRFQDRSKKANKARKARKRAK